jgi:formate hydrogenlyase subunit 4
MVAMPTLSAFVALVLLVLGAPIVPGIASRTKSILAGRRGSPVWQLYADLWKLARRGLVYSVTTTWVFRLAPILLVATTLAAATLVPLDGHASILAFSGDVVAFAYLLGLGRFALVLASLDTGSSFEGMGASREVTFAALVEPGIFIGLATLGVLAHEFSLSAMLGAAQPRANFAAAGPSSVMVGLSLFALALAECSRVPVDDPTTHLELTMVHEVMVLDNSGPDLAAILYASSLKLALFSVIIVSVFVPGARATGWFGLGLLIASFVVVPVAIGIVESVVARLRLPKVPLYIAGGSALAVFGLILVLR